MSTLQLGLAVAGGVVLAAMVAHSAWASRRNTPRQPQHPSADPQQEPSLHGDDMPDTVPMESMLDEFGSAKPASLQPRKPAMDALIDVIATVALDPHTPAVLGEVALAALPASLRAGSKPMLVEGYNLQSLLWELPAVGQRYGGFQVGVQLANRSGALNEIEFSEFVAKTQAFADALSASPEFPDMLHEVARAKELDQFASAHDAQLAFSIRARSAAWSIPFIQQCVAQQGFVAGVIPGRLVLPTAQEGLPPVLVLQFDSQVALSDDPLHSAIRALTLQLDVAHVAQDERPFERMRAVANALAVQMDGVVTDDQGNPLLEPSLDAIANDLQGLYAALEQHDLKAGSPQARRLFS
ncbi:cell division protein FtsZ [Curvibacter sp. CHRR-16]|uniref:cell division protein ZipA C-terminal FtsZ-binding domain-containing protein n=1 Tax=Curvibacter sp. CHRR-16 TaxID=2835872 RepID=UPI001BDAA38C|nr:cell division protein ZipA C-terminal FtsZ-binding domain-containing protein [Curvibacter sp. CHRR-16]MBT0571798.1 cell division protein FtsZ [Curvibacter sp. CHRR-16]